MRVGKVIFLSALALSTIFCNDLNPVGGRTGSRTRKQGPAGCARKVAGKRGEEGARRVEIPLEELLAGLALGAKEDPVVTHIRSCKDPELMRRLQDAEYELNLNHEQKAFELYLAIAKEYPDDPLAFYRLGQIYESNEQIADASDHYLRAYTLGWAPAQDKIAKLLEFYSGRDKNPPMSDSAKQMYL
jgi:tetratricopeptide (TPR) repeat protein